MLTEEIEQLKNIVNDLEKFSFSVKTDNREKALEVCEISEHIQLANEEYIQSCNHKELTEILFRMIVNGSVIRPDRQYISEWLKQPHTDKE